jgi:putative restriction endonuclease
MFGHIDEILAGQIFSSRKEVAVAGVHAPLMSSIWGAKEGAYSIVLSGGYEDDIDDLNYILYTGQGGQDAPGGKQVADQEFTKGNRGLQLSCQYGLPVRVVRGHQIFNGPENGYRYDGLYYVESFERIIGKRGFYICRFHLISENSINQLENILKPNLKSSYIRPDRVQTTTNRLQRNVKLSEKIKKTYSHQCQVCNVTLDSPSGPIAIGAHVRGLGRPHNGPDIIENMLCLCPNHHDQFDYLSFYIEPDTFQIIGLEGYGRKKLNVHSRHKLSKEFLEYHKQLFLKNSGVELTK